MSFNRKKAEYRLYKILPRQPVSGRALQIASMVRYEYILYLAYRLVSILLRRHFVSLSLISEFSLIRSGSRICLAHF